MVALDVNAMLTLDLSGCQDVSVQPMNPSVASKSTIAIARTYPVTSQVGSGKRKDGTRGIHQIRHFVVLAPSD